MLRLRRSNGRRAKQSRQVFFGSLVAIFTACLLMAFSCVYGAFELKPLPPAERGTATRVAEGTPFGISPAPGTAKPGGVRLRSVQVYGFKPFGLDEVSFVGMSADLALGRVLDLYFAYQALSVLSYVEQTYLISCHWKTGRLRFEPAVRLGTVSLEHSIIDHALLFDIACYARLLPDIEIFLGARNPFALGLARAGERCPVDIAVGLGYNICESITFGVEASKEAGFPTSIATGVEVLLVKGVKLRSGIRSDPKEFCMGLGLGVGRIALDMSTSLHLDLGITHEAGLTYRRDQGIR